MQEILAKNLIVLKFDRTETASCSDPSFSYDFGGVREFSSFPVIEGSRKEICRKTKPHHQRLTVLGSAGQAQANTVATVTLRQTVALSGANVTVTGARQFSFDFSGGTGFTGTAAGVIDAKTATA